MAMFQTENWRLFLEVSKVFHFSIVLYITKESKGKKTLIFDLDETLIHCNENQNSQSDVRVPVTFPNGVKIMAGNIIQFCFFYLFL